MFKLKFPRERRQPRSVSIDPIIIRKFHAGDCESFTEIYRTFKAPLFSFLLRRTEGAGAAEDLSHDIFLKVLKSRTLYDPSQDFEPWFWTIARNTLNDHLRRKMHLAPSIQVDGPEADEEGISVQVSTEDIESLVLTNSDRTVLLKFLGGLTRLQREALSLRLVQKLSYDEISKKMSLSLSAVKSLIHRAQLSLKQAFHKENRRQLQVLHRRT